MYIKVIDYCTKAPSNDMAIKFRNEVVIPGIIMSIANKEKLVIDFDGAYGYPTTFINMVFGGLVKMNIFSPRTLKNVLEFKSTEADYLKDEIEKDMKEGRSYVKYKRR